METINTNVVKQQPKLTGQIGNTLIYVDPDLEDKKVEIVENGVYTIKADEKFDGLNEVEVVTNVNNIPETGVVVTACAADGSPMDIEIFGVKKIEEQYFLGGNGDKYGNFLRNALRSIIFHDDLSGYIPNYTFAYCKNLKNVEWKGMSSWGQATFEYCTALETATIPDGVTSIAGYNFRGCTALKTVYMPEGLTNIYDYTFQNCSKLNIKRLPSTLASFSSVAFANCTSITQLSMGGIKSFAWGSSSPSFYGCTGLRAVWIGSSIDSGLGRYAFQYASNMVKIFIDKPRAEVETFANYQYAFVNNANKTNIIVCNDDEGWMTQDEFDAIDWKNYTE